MSDKQIKTYCTIDNGAQRPIEMAIEKLGLSALDYTDALKIARTISDIEEEEKKYAPVMSPKPSSTETLIEE